jgi:hypothetical protein
MMTTAGRLALRHATRCQSDLHAKVVGNPFRKLGLSVCLKMRSGIQADIAYCRPLLMPTTSAACQPL